MPRRKKPQTKAEARAATASARHRKKERDMNPRHTEEPPEPPEPPQPPPPPGRWSCTCGWTGTDAEAEQHALNAPAGHQLTEVPGDAAQ